MSNVDYMFWVHTYSDDEAIEILHGLRRILREKNSSDPSFEFTLYECKVKLRFHSKTQARHCENYLMKRQYTINYGNDFWYLRMGRFRVSQEPHKEFVTRRPVEL